MLPMKALHGACNGQEKLYVDDVFSTYLYTGNGSTQTINNGIDLAGKGGLVWIKGRSGATDHQLFDTARTATYELISNSTAAQVADTDTLTAFNSTGFALGADATTNTNAATYVSWTFRKAPKFFDVVTYTGNGSIKTISHSLGVAPGMVVVKRTDTTGNWGVYHRSLSDVDGFNAYLKLNTTDASALSSPSRAFSASSFSVQGFMNLTGATYVAYLFAHDTATDGIIQCGSFTADGSGNATVNLGWADGAQYVQIKASSTTGDWEIYDTARTAAWSGSDARLRANLSNAEDAVSRLSASGSSVSFTGLSASQTYIYMAIASPTN